MKKESKITDFEIQAFDIHQLNDDTTGLNTVDQKNPAIILEDMDDALF